MGEITQMSRSQQRKRDLGGTQHRFRRWEIASDRRTAILGRDGDVLRATLGRNRGRRRRALFGSVLAAVVFFGPGKLVFGFNGLSNPSFGQQWGCRVTVNLARKVFPYLESAANDRQTARTVLSLERDIVL